MKSLHSKLTYANVMVTVLAFIVLAGGTAYAASEMLPKGSVGTKQLTKEAVTPAKLSRASKATLTGPTGPTGATGPQGLKGDTGAKGDRGEGGLRGEIGPSDAYEVGNPGTVASEAPLSLSLPAGNYIAIPKVTVYAAPEEEFVECTLAAGGRETRLYASVTSAVKSDTTLSGSLTFNLASPESVTLSCIGAARFGYANITAIKVGTLN